MHKVVFSFYGPGGARTSLRSDPGNHVEQLPQRNRIVKVLETTSKAEALTTYVPSRAGMQEKLNTAQCFGNHRCSLCFQRGAKGELRNLSERAGRENGKQKEGRGRERGATGTVRCDTLAHNLGVHDGSSPSEPALKLGRFGPLSSN
ncbi:unnamed protein product [Prorocentrum cordatum]|uniref:Uncharacterized protein n=1 Tax=Prorocentrum cordatum TaxID=2364126 RepID=A0ABN9VTW7_9DINO|nr:unnamed protein product [Polarella glacialis]